MNATDARRCRAVERIQLKSDYWLRIQGALHGDER